MTGNITSISLDRTILGIGTSSQWTLKSLSADARIFFDQYKYYNTVKTTDALLTMESTLLKGNDLIVGTSSNVATDFDVLIGFDGNDRIYGKGGNDVLLGENNDDILDGGRGADRMFGGAGNDTYYIDNTSDKVYETATATSSVDVGGNDTVFSYLAKYTLGNYIEKLTLLGTALNGAGNALNNTLVGNGSANTLNGNAGNDYIDGGTGNDAMYGGLGNDTYIVNRSTDRVIEYAGQGTDTIRSYVNFSLLDTDGAGTYGGNVEKLTLLGTALNGAGNALNNTLVGNGSANTLNGNAGNDYLAGGAGNDILNGGAGMDSFVFNTALNASSNKDTIIDFNVSDDTIRLENAIMTGLGSATGTLVAEAFHNGTINYATQLDDRIIYNTSTGALFYDADGSAAGSAAVQIAIIGTTTHAALTNADFLVI